MFYADKKVIHTLRCVSIFVTRAKPWSTGNLILVADRELGITC